MVKKIVLTGGPCSGKSTLIEELEQRGYKAIHEIARQVIIERKNFPISYEEIFWRQAEIFKRQLKAEEEIPTTAKGGLVLLDRSIIDGMGYSKYYLGRLPFDIFEARNLPKRYSLIFNLEALPLVQDGIRIEKNNDEARAIHVSVLHEYWLRNYEPIMVPIMSVNERADFILGNLQQKELIDGMH